MTDPGPSGVTDAAQRLRTAFLAAAKFDVSPEAQEAINGAIEAIDENGEMFQKFDAKALESAGAAQFIFAVFKVIEANDVTALKSLATKDFAKELGGVAKTRNLWGALTGDSKARQLRIRSLGGKFLDGSTMRVGISWTTATGVEHEPEDRNFWIVREGNVWRLAGIRGIGVPPEGLEK